MYQVVGAGRVVQWPDSLAQRWIDTMMRRQANSDAMIWMSTAASLPQGPCGSARLLGTSTPLASSPTSGHRQMHPCSIHLRAMQVLAAGHLSSLVMRAVPSVPVRGLVALGPLSVTLTVWSVVHPQRH